MQKNRKKIAILFHGLVHRSLEYTVGSFEKYILHPLQKDNDVDVFHHSWITETMNNPRGNENNVQINKNAIDDFLPYSRGIVENQEEYDATIDPGFFNDKNPMYLCNDKPEDAFITAMNSLRDLESTKRAFAYMEENITDVKYDYVIVCRPDVEYLSKFKMECIEDKTILVPFFGKWAGENDRFAIGSYDAMKIYCNRIEGALDWMKYGLARNSESYLKEHLTKNGLLTRDIYLFFRRIRATGEIPEHDMTEIKVGSKVFFSKNVFLFKLTTFWKEGRFLDKKVLPAVRTLQNKSVILVIRILQILHILPILRRFGIIRVLKQLTSRSLRIIKKSKSKSNPKYFFALLINKIRSLFPRSINRRIPNKVVLVCIAKDEDNYIEEWIAYNLKLGFDKIIIYANDWGFESTNDKVEVHHVEGKAQQTKVYNSFIKKNHKLYDWAAFFDVDEFLYLRKHENIKEFISDYAEFEAVLINWVFFGDNGHKKIINNNYSLLNRFTKRGGTSEIIKSIVKIKKGVRFDEDPQNPHSPSRSIKVDTSRRLIEKAAKNTFGNIDIAQINHYFCKTFDEYTDVKIARGRATMQVTRRETDDIYELFKTRNQNQIEDTLARDFLYNQER